MVDETEAGKGRATPSRKDAEAARKARLKAPVSRKDQAKRERAARDELRLKQRDALKTGDERYLPARERGPVRHFARDFVDRRRNVGELLIPFLFVVLVLLFVFGAINPDLVGYLTTFVYPLVIIGVVVDFFVLRRSLRRELKERFEPDETKGTIAYATLRSMQLRRMRLPKPQLKHGAPMKARY
ncbi:MAG: DUF3043 domain-containing protein [Aeromicrobium sp.]